MSRAPTLIKAAPRFATESPSEEDYEEVSQLIPDLRLNTFGVSFKLFEELKTPVITPDNCDFVVVAWVVQEGAFAGCAKLTAVEDESGVLSPILDVYRLCRYDLEINRVDTYLVADAWASLTTRKRTRVRFVIEKDGTWQEPDLARAEDGSPLIRGLTPNNWGIQLLDQYNGGRFLHMGRRALDRLNFSLLKVMLPWF